MPTENVTFEGTNGNKLSGKLDLPDGGLRAYALMVHGFTLGKDSPAASRTSKALAKAGIGSLRFDFTGLGDSEGDFADATFSNNVANIEYAAEFMKSQGRTLSLVVGHSLGGAAILSAAQNLDEIDAFVTIGAPYDPAHLEHAFEPVMDEIFDEGSAEIKVGGRSLNVRKELLEDLRSHDLTTRIETLRRPLLVMHSPTDNQVGIENAGRIFNAARHPKSFISLEGSDHLLLGRGDARRAANIVSAWADQYLELDDE
ncbi:alpha/beta hydrolase family protein [Arthrobacter castelli]|uniref:alpha/beta hydrolase family protein n=1 Tax=Arthrobacter castelli TaxID=271431 RepID=UPI00042082C4|nr:alpha/beta hydrolase [Arthrobacter castelli]